uniref:Uncharacterized protein n=1 Tax=Pseudomonas aeruginosa TaxID=287 RepID=A0A6C0L3D7_PSEAI|nr:hypothetical protein [Pseudomonas aeruginosa]
MKHIKTFQVCILDNSVPDLRQMRSRTPAGRRAGKEHNARARQARKLALQST